MGDIRITLTDEVPFKHMQVDIIWPCSNMQFPVQFENQAREI